MNKIKKLFIVFFAIIIYFIFSTSVHAAEGTFDEFISMYKDDYPYYVELYGTEGDKKNGRPLYYFSKTPFYLNDPYLYSSSSFIQGYYNTQYEEPFYYYDFSPECLDSGKGITAVDESIRYNISFYEISYSNHDILYKDSTDNTVFFRNGGVKTPGQNNSNPDSSETENGNNEDTERTGFFASVGNWFNSVISGLTQGFTDVIQNIASVLEYLNPFSENFILKGVLDFLGNILSYLNPFSENFILKGILNFLGNILNYLNPFSEDFFGKKIAELIKNVLTAIFVPDEEVLNDLISVVTNRFSFINTIKSNINGLKENLSDSSYNTNLVIDVSSKYYNGSVTVINLSWLADYKYLTDPIFTGFFYLLFLWRLFVKVPNIIKGQSSESIERGNTN